MLAKSYRIPSCLIREILRRGQKHTDSGFQLVICKNSSRLSRFAFVVPYSVDKHATARNRLRRLAAESVRLLNNNVLGGFDVIIIVKKKRENATIETVKPVIEGLLKKANLL